MCGWCVVVYGLKVFVLNGLMFSVLKDYSYSGKFVVRQCHTLYMLVLCTFFVCGSVFFVVLCSDAIVMLCAVDLGFDVLCGDGNVS